MMRLALTAVGRGTRGFLALVGSVTRLDKALCAKALELPRLNLRLIGRLTMNQIRFTGLDAAPLVAVAAALAGTVSIIQSFNRLTALAPDLIGSLLVSIIVRELGPLITAVILISRSGTAMSAELGMMRLSGEMEALRAYRIDPVDFVILPRVLGMVLSMFALIVLFDLFGILGGFGISALIQDISFSLLRARVMSALTSTDLFVSVLKALAFGQTISVICCAFGLRVRTSPAEVPQAVTKAVVASLLALFVLDSLAAAAFYLR